MNLPWGTSVWLPEDCDRLRAAEEKLRALFRDSGAGEIATPAFEYAEALERGFGHPEKFFRFLDGDGSILALRPELTTPAARLFATALAKRPLPLRVYYLGQVYRQESKHKGLFREFRQAGYECYGGDRLDEDARAITLAAQSLSRLGATDAVIEIGHVGIAEGILDELDPPSAARSAWKDAIARKDAPALRAAKAPDLLPRLLGLDAAEILRDASAYSKSPEVLGAIDELKALRDRLAGLAHRVVVEPLSIRHHDYYTGVVFEGLLPRSGRPVLSGGRYDRLVEQFGDPAAATGFSLELELLLRR